MGGNPHYITAHLNDWVYYFPVLCRGEYDGIQILQGTVDNLNRFVDFRFQLNWSDLLLAKALLIRDRIGHTLPNERMEIANQFS